MRGSVALDAHTGKAFEHGQQLVGTIARMLDSMRTGRRSWMGQLTHENTVKFDSLIARHERRDAFDPAAGMHMARQLEHVYEDVLRETFPVPNAFELFPLDTTVQPGAKTHTVRRLYQAGEVAVYTAGMKDIPRIGLSQQEEEFPVRHYVTSWVYSLFEAMSSQFANTALVQELARAGRDLVMEFANQKSWYGDDDHGIYGVTNYPWMYKMVLPYPITDASTPAQILGQLNDLFSYPHQHTKATMSPDTCAMAPRLREYLFTRYRSDDSDLTIGEALLKNQKRIKDIEEAWELQGTGPGGTDGILCYRRDRRGITNVFPQMFTTLPIQSFGFDDVTYAYMSHGGVVMRDCGNNIMGWAEGPSL